MTEQSTDLDYISKGPTGGTARKLVVLCHGYGYNASFMEKQAEEILAKIPDALVIMPQAPEALSTPEDGGSTLKIPQQVTDNKEDLSDEDRRQWFSIDGDDMEEIQERSLKAARKLNQLIDKKRNELGITDKDISIMGLSQGGNIALNAAYQRDNEIASVVGHSTLIGIVPEFTSKPSTYYIYGDNDEEFDVSFYEGVAQIIQQYGAPLKTTEVAGLQHRTSAESRELVANYIKDQFNPPSPRPRPMKFLL